MHYCSYHPLIAASHQCESCYRQQCASCVDDDGHCFVCGQLTQELGMEHRVEPFWRRLQAAFRYPLNGQAASLILGISAVTGALSYLPSLSLVTWIISLIASGIIMKYSFKCLENTAAGRMEAPDISEAYQGGVGLLIQLLLMVIALAGMVYGVAYLFGPKLAALTAFFFIIGLPAMLISFALTENLLAAINPINTFQLMTRIGLPYGLLLALIMVMAGSVSVIHQIIGDRFFLISTILQSAASNYYMVVVFHIMGYVIFQYQDKLGFSAQGSQGDDRRQRTEEDNLSARVGVFLKEGHYDKVYRLFDEALRRTPDNKRFNAQYFELLYQLKDRAQMSRFATRYLQYAQRQGHAERLCDVYRQIREVAPDCIPQDPDLRVQLAKEGLARSEYGIVVRLINGLHKQHPGYAGLKEAFELMASALDQLPNRQQDAVQCRKLAARLAIRQPEAKPATQPPPRSRFLPQEPEPQPSPASEPGESLEDERWKPIEFK